MTIVTCEQIEYHMLPNCPNTNWLHVHALPVNHIHVFCSQYTSMQTEDPFNSDSAKHCSTEKRKQHHQQTPKSAFINSQNPMCHSIIRPLLSENSHGTTAEKMINRTRYIN
jgi:hypothetical protein